MKKFITIAFLILLSAKIFADMHGVQGGLVICVGGADLSSDWNKPGCIFQCLETSATAVSNLRNTIRSAGLYGKVTARKFDGTNLPFIDHTANLVVVGAGSTISEDELMRVLAPRGVAVVDGEELVKPVPAEIDDWTHFYYNAEGTMVGGDTAVGPPRRIQWMGDPKWLRNHDFMSSMHAMVSSGGRIFYVIDEGLRNHIFLPSDWQLVARDAFNGTILWKKPLDSWHPHNWPLKSGPGDLPRRLVAADGKVYVTDGLLAPLTAFDAATGEEVQTYAGTETTTEIIYSDGTLFLMTDPDKQPVDYTAIGTGYSEIKRAETNFQWSAGSPVRKIMAVDADAGTIIWEHSAKAVPQTLVATDKKVYFHNGAGMVALSRKNGEELWTTTGPTVTKELTGGRIRVAVSDGALVLLSSKKATVFSAESGAKLWSHNLQTTGHHCSHDLFIIDDEIWSPKTGKNQAAGTHYLVFDLHTGATNQDFRATNISAFPMHPRCYPSRATKRYIITNGMGCEFYELGDTKVDINHFVRGSCIYGLMPANGLLYKPADSCACYYQSKLEHFCALAPAGGSAPPEIADRLEEGPVYSLVAGLNYEDSASDWPMYRHDPARSGASPVSASSDLQPAWTNNLNGTLTPPVVSGSKVFVAAIDQHTLYAIDTSTGITVWQFTADGRIDSPPTIHKGTVIFGSADGYAYCLRAEDGALAWRYLVAPSDRQLISYDQPESVWPLNGSILVQDDIIYCLAGRSMFFDGGLRLVRLDTTTGTNISERIMDEYVPGTDPKEHLQERINAKYMPVANPDLFSSDGEKLYMQTQSFSLEGDRYEIDPILPGNATSNAPHLFCQTGFLDKNWFHRSFWIYANNCGEGWGAYWKTHRDFPSGRIMAFDQDQIYGSRATPLQNMLLPRQTYTLYASSINDTNVPFVTNWETTSPDLTLLINGMALGGTNLFVAGPPDLADETQMLGYLPGSNDTINAELADQEDAWKGNRGGILWVVSTNGVKISEYNLSSYPVFDGLITAEGKLFMSMLDGTVQCFE